MKAYKRMLGNTIYRLRKEKGLSQAQLGKLVGVSNKAVSKWETDEANPDINIIPLLGEVLGVTTDELLNDIKLDKEEIKPKDAKVFGLSGKLTDTSEEYEFVSDKKTKKGTPYLHIHVGKKLTTLNAKARGIVAIGNNAKGILALGFVSKGIISIGLLSLGLLSLGLLSLGLLTVGSFAVGGIAVGAIAVGVIAIGAIAIGFISIGAIAIGYYAHTGEDGIALGKHIFIHKNKK